MCEGIVACQAAKESTFCEERTQIPRGIQLRNWKHCSLVPSMVLRQVLTWIGSSAFFFQRDSFNPIYEYQKWRTLLLDSIRCDQLLDPIHWDRVYIHLST